MTHKELADSGCTEPPTDPGCTEPPTDPGCTEPPADPGCTEPPTDPGCTEPPTSEQRTAKERITDLEVTNVDSLTNDCTGEGQKESAKSSSLGQESDETEELVVTVAETVTSSHDQDDETVTSSRDQDADKDAEEVKTSKQLSCDGETTSRENAEMNVSKRKTRSKAIISTDTRTGAARSSRGTTYCDGGNTAEIPAQNAAEIPAQNAAEIPAQNTAEIPAQNAAEIPAQNTAEIPARKTRSRGNRSSHTCNNAESKTAVLEAKTNENIMCDTHKDTDVSTPIRQTRRRKIISHTEMPRRKTRSAETISCDTPGGTELNLNTPGKQTNGSISCDTARVTRSGLKVGISDPVKKRSIKSNRTWDENDKKTGKYGREQLD